MELKEAKLEFIQSWGNFGTNWGINKTMAMISALLLVSPKALSTEDIMEELKISRGNANMNLRALMDWGIVRKANVLGERREFFEAEKDIMTLAKQVVRERRKREITPVLKVLDNLSNVNGDSEEAKEFRNVIENIRDFTGKMDRFGDTFENSQDNWFYKALINFVP